ncbi:MAG: SDR family NAD(P)-dependent oxidoreductase [bacterium]|nr:SDR family NAD(P)-dependent oxidoreductase [bacterium]
MNRVSAVTGAAGGVGRTAVEALAGAGFSVVLMGRSTLRMEEIAATLPAGPHRVVRCDVRDRQSVREAFADVEREYSRLDFFFNNAGVSGPETPLQFIRDSDWLDVIDTNVTGAFMCAQAAFLLMSRQQPGGGRIINNGSVSAFSPRPGRAAYTVSKHAITGLTRAIALEGRELGVSCGQIDIGNARTSMTPEIGERVLQADGRSRPEASFAVESLDEAIRFLALLPGDVTPLNLTLFATEMPLVGRG